eukprot:1159010-Pelagomonas_calceolata.AAC.7
MEVRWLSSKLEWSADGLHSPQIEPTSGLKPSKGTHKSLLMKLVSTGAVPVPEVAGLGKSKTELLESLLPSFTHRCTPLVTNLGHPGRKPCLASMLRFRVDGRLAGLGRVLSAKMSKRHLQHQPLPPTPSWHSRAAKQFCLGW